MGRALMADDLSFLVGELKGGFAQVLRRLDKSDEQTDAKIKDLAGQVQDLSDQHERDKAEAIQRGNDGHGQTQLEIRKVQEATSLTGGRVAVIEKALDEEIRPVLKWHHDEGSKLGGRVSTLEQAEVARALEKAQADRARAGQEGEKRGRTWAITKIIALIAAICGVLGWLGADRLSAFLFSISVKLGHG